ncbi:hypothetical protein H2200_012621 [Cladophialophora chaetospira]|uniref:Uncharacterized protein n=1 Tax=Cladophialophora chaetospira TaxID=386627 RepID=A0AA39CC59_9EURO|nr:hypothetical protein H2200_012621 [Cladophialophora chaetospira]
MTLLRRTAVGPERRNPCTHMNMTRLFDVYGSFKCALCHKHPSIGWLYRCTQDAGGFLPESDFTLEPSVGRSRLDQEVTTHSLSSSVIKASGQGQYTDEQVKKLIELKEGVRELVMAQQRSDDGRPDTSSTFATVSSASSSSSDGDCSFSTIPQSTTFSTNSSTSLDEEIKQAYDWKELQKVWMSEPSMAPPEPRTSSFPPSLPPADPLPPRPTVAKAVPALPALPAREPCTFKICATCRPTYRERAYQSLEEILNKPVQIPPVWEMQNRRVSDARVLARIGSPKLDRNRFYSQTDPAALLSSCTIPGIVINGTNNEVDFTRSGEDEDIAYMPGADSRPDRSHFEDSELCGNSAHTPGPCENKLDATVDSHSFRKRSGFRDSVRKVLSMAHRENVITGDSSTSTSESSTDSQARPPSRSRVSSSLIFRRRRSRASTFSFMETPGARIVDTSPLQDSVTLMVATNTPLPQTPALPSFNFGQGNDDSLAGVDIRVEESYFPPMQMISQA